jgi:hypothetical protein
LKVKYLKRKLRSLLEEPHGVVDQLDQFLDPQVYTRAVLMFILSVLFSREEKGMIRRVAMMVWEHEHPLGPNVLPADVKILNQDPQWDNNDAVHWGYIKDLRDLILKGI